MPDYLGNGRWGLKHLPITPPPGRKLKKIVYKPEYDEPPVKKKPARKRKATKRRKAAAPKATTKKTVKPLPKQRKRGFLGLW